jgi:phytoene dehydrogenase-like protein
MQGVDMSTVGMSHPPELTNIFGRAKEFWGMRRLWKYFSGKYGKSVAEYVKNVKDPWLAECIKNLFLPEVPVWFIFMILALLADHQIGFLEGGCLDFVLALEKRFKDLGGQVTYRATVKKILVENERAAGVRLADGSEHRAKAVVSAADGRSTIFEMLGGRYVDKNIKRRYGEWASFAPFVLVSYGVAREFPDSPPFITFKMKDPLTVNNKPIRGYFIRLLNYSRRFAPPGKTVVQVEFESEWDYWDNLQRKDRAQYDAEKERVAGEMLKQLEAHFPGISRQVEMIDIATPFTLWRCTLNHKAAWEGWLITPETIKSSVKRTLPGLSDFYMAGQWVMPGGGVPPCLISGRHIAQLLCKRDQKAFVTTKA